MSTIIRPARPSRRVSKARFTSSKENRFVINHAILLKFKRDGDIKDKSSVDFILKLDKELRNWYRKSSISIFQSYDDRYNKPLRGWDDICENFFDELPN